MDDVVELLGCGSVSTKTISSTAADNIPDIRKLAVELEKGYSKRLQAEEEENELRKAEQLRSARSTRAARKSTRRSDEAEADEADKPKETQDDVSCHVFTVPICS